MGVVKRALRPGVGFFDRRVDWRVDQKLTGYARQGDLNSVSDSLTKIYADLLEATTDLRRWLADDLDAAQETATLIGRSLTRLTDSVERLEADLAAVAERVARIETAVTGRAAASPPPE